MAEEFVGEPQVVVQGQNSHSLKTDHDDLQRGHNRKHILNDVQCPYRQQRNLLSIFNIPDLNHPHKALWVFLKDRQKGIDRQSEDSGHFCRSRWDSFIRSLVTLKYRNVQTCELCRGSRMSFPVSIFTKIATWPSYGAISKKREEKVEGTGKRTKYRNK